jgi:leucyl aminopeptidase
VVVSLGESASLSALKLWKAARCLTRWLLAERLRQATLWVGGLLSSGVEHPISDWALGMVLAGFRFNEHRKPDEKTIAKVRIALASEDPASVDARLPRIREQVRIAEAVNYARWLGHQPANVLNPSTLAAEARRLAQKQRLKCTVLEFPRVKRLGMGGLAAVGRGAEQKPCLIRLDYRGAPRARTNVVLVGKAITFDTGGYSIKTAAGMEALKFDKCGGAAVMGVLLACAVLRLPVNATGLVAAAENAISQEAFRPGDILTMASGKTVEVISTDAEGRLVLADALWYAQAYCRPTAVIDIATLTGGIVTALGKVAAGLMSNDDDLSAELGEAGRQVHERLWRLPLWDEYRELIKGTEADLRNSAGKRDAQTIVGGMFLKEFVAPGMAWAHIDIAAVATSEESNTPTGKGATGFGVQLLVEYLRRTA